MHYRNSINVFTNKEKLKKCNIENWSFGNKVKKINKIVGDQALKNRGALPSKSIRINKPKIIIIY